MSNGSSPASDRDAYASLFDRLKDLGLFRHDQSLTIPTIAPAADIKEGISTLVDTLPQTGLGLATTGSYLFEQVLPTLAPGHNGTRYFGFVTGGCLPIATIADQFLPLLDNSAQVHLPKETLCTVIEAYTVKMLCELLSLPVEDFTGTITTGATASNILGLACGREVVLKEAMRRRGHPNWSLAEEGWGEDEEEEVVVARVDVFCAYPHASVKKAAAILGIGRSRIRDLSTKPASNSHDDSMAVLDLDLELLETRLRQNHQAKRGSMVLLTMGEVNTGALTAQTPAVRKLCDQYGAWLHIDAAFSAFVTLIGGYEWIGKHLAMADSITSDGHKQINVPYDCGLFFVRKKKDSSTTSHLQDVFGTGSKGQAPAYLSNSATENNADSAQQTKEAFIASLPSPLFQNIENSRRFRALPLYLTLLSEGRHGIAEMVERNVYFARALERWVRKDEEASRYYQVLTPELCPPYGGNDMPWSGIWSTTILLFRPHPLTCPRKDFIDPIQGSNRCIDAIKQTRRMYVSPTVWNGRGAIRIAVSNWRTGLEDAAGRRVDNVEESEDWRIVTETLRQVMKGSEIQ